MVIEEQMESKKGELVNVDHHCSVLQCVPENQNSIDYTADNKKLGVT